MSMTRRRLLGRLLAMGAMAGVVAGVASRRARAAAVPLRVGVLRYGTVSWELDVIRRHGLDTAHGLALVSQEFATGQATQVALQAGQVDTIAVDWLWVARQRAAQGPGGGADWTFIPFSNVAGAVMVPAGSPVATLADLAGRRLGIAGGPLDKSWLILRAYAQRQAGIDLDRATEKTFGAPPLLANALAAGRLDALLTYWPFAARGQAAGQRTLLTVEDAVSGLGIQGTPPIVGYVFSERWAKANGAVLDGFIAASRQARALLTENEAEWPSLRPLADAGSDAEFLALRDWYRRGIPPHWGPAEWQAAARLYQVLAAVGGPALVGDGGDTLPAGTFWRASSW
ncbi:ABC transporter substrate-binding protein [Nitrospirillum pindoramense]|uniref:NitT/TauT family transport system substrate-binding protein n=1 Tax=Nitrospirillum amazonense TaxID=28077 RepID=A0A560GTE7_9PROT|nr:ABC transporter substrate-binding protein [Nitrospirillum amazonense]TWB37248.1 NitT/TauT family transport system substrate-binding protein [Nitrospirillum amazonense]